MDLNNLYSVEDSDEEGNPPAGPSMGVQGPPPDQIQYQQAMGQQQQFVDPRMIFDAATERNQAFRPQPTQPQSQEQPQDEILDADFPVQIGRTRFATLREAINGATALEPPVPGLFTQVHGRNVARWDSSMINEYPYYDDGPRVASEEGDQRIYWEPRVINARNQMGIILRPVPGGVDRPPPGPSRPELRDRIEAGRQAREDANSEDKKHKRRLDPTDPTYDAQYARVWNAQQAAIRQHNAIQRAAGLRARREFDVENGRPAGPDPQVPADEGNDLFDFYWHRPRPVGPVAPPAQQGNMQSGSQGANPGTLTRCSKCKRHKKGCSLPRTGVPCTRCAENNYECVPVDIPRNYTTPAGARPRQRGSSKMQNEAQSTPNRGRVEKVAANETPLQDRMDAIASTLGPAPAIQGPSLFRRRDEGIRRRRSASPLRGILLGEKCDNCELYGRLCEDERPCLDCLQRNIVCQGNYLGNRYRTPRSDDGSDRSGYGAFGQEFRDMGYGGGNGGNNASNNSPGSGQGGMNVDGSTQQYQNSLQGAMDIVSAQALPSQSNLGGSVGTLMEGYNDYNNSFDDPLPFAALRKFNARHSTSLGPSLMVFTPTRVMENAARASNAYNEPDERADTTTTLNLRSRATQEMQNTAQVGYRAQQAAAVRDFIRLQERAENGTNQDREMMARLTAHLQEGVDASSTMAFEMDPRLAE